MKKIQIKTNKKERKAERNEVTALLFLIFGVLGILLLLYGASGITFSRGLVYPVAVLSSVLIWLSYRHGKLVFLAAGAELLAGGLLILVFWDQISSQFRTLGGVLLMGQDVGAADVTEMALAGSIFLSLFLFVLEFGIRNHSIGYLLTTALLLAAPVLGVGITAEALLLLLLFQAGFWMNRRTGKQGIVMAVGVVLIFGASCVLAATFSRQLYQFAYEAEGVMSRALHRISGRENNIEAQGEISRGNNYLSGVPQLDVQLSRQPSEALYLRGFEGGSYEDSEWGPARDEEIYQEMAELLGWDEWEGWIQGMHESAYFTMNAARWHGEDPQLGMLIRHRRGGYDERYEPYYGWRRYTWDSRWEEQEGYLWRFYEQKDVQIDWENVSPEFEQARDWYRQVEMLYQELAEAVYTQVPMEELPRLSALVQEYPLTGTDEITAFIITALEDQASYTRTPGWAPFNKDIVEYFLFDSHQGYCQHFASAATLMYRMYGIPARYASGYRIQPSDFTRNEEGAWEAVVTDEAAHAWVEIFLPDYGWTPVEVTPASDGSIGAAYPGVDAEELEELARERGWEIELSLAGESREGTDLSEEGQERDFLPEMEVDVELSSEFLAAAGVFLLYSMLVLPLLLDYRRLRIRARMEEMSCRQIFDRLLDMLHYCGILVEEDGTEPDFGKKLAEAVPGIQEAEAVRFQEIVHLCAYGEEKAGKEKAQETLRFYRDTAKILYEKLPGRRKIVFRYIRGF